MDEHCFLLAAAQVCLFIFILLQLFRGYVTCAVVSQLIFSTVPNLSYFVDFYIQLAFYTSEMSLVQTKTVLCLYRSLIREAKKWKAYNYR